MFDTPDPADAPSTTKPPSSPYRWSASRSPALESPWPTRTAITAALLTATTIAACVTWGMLPWKQHHELRTTNETSMPHERIASVWWSAEGWAIAVGARGQILLRDGSPNPAEPWSWRALPATTVGDLTSVAGGYLDSLAGAGEHAMVAGDGAILDCTRAGCVPLVAEGHHRAVAVSGGEALVVGDGGDVRWIVEQDVNRRPGELADAGAKLRADRIADLGVTTDFRSVALECDADTDRTRTGRARSWCSALLRTPTSTARDSRRASTTTLSPRPPRGWVSATRRCSSTRQVTSTWRVDGLG